MIPTKQHETHTQLRAFLQISRANLLLTSIGHATLGMILAAGSLSALIQVKTLLYILLHYSIALFGCIINSYYDYQVDTQYKKYMADGVDVFGRSKIKLFLFIEAFAVVILIGWFVFYGYLIVAGLGLIGFFAAFSYSAEPMRIKKHGLLSPVPVLILYTVPILGGWFLFRNDVTFLFILFVIGYMLMNQGFTLVNTCEDYTEDKQEGITTWAHVFGLRKTLMIATIFSIAGLLCVGAMAGMLIPLFTLVDVIDVILLCITGVLITKAAWEVRQVSKGDDLEKKAKLYGTRLQRWFMMTRYPLMITGLFLLL